jgi:hypothetical protein
VGNTNDRVDVFERSREQFVREYAGRVVEAEQAVVGEDRPHTQ